MHEVRLAIGRAQQKRHQLFGVLELQPLLQELAEQVVQTQRQRFGVERRDEQAALLELFQPLRCPRITADLCAALDAEFLEHRAAQQELAHRDWQLVEHLADEVVEQAPPLVADPG